MLMSGLRNLKDKKEGASISMGVDWDNLLTISGSFAIHYLIR